MNNQITKSSLLLRENIDQHDFTLSLIKEGARAGLLSEAQVVQLQTDLLQLLSEIILHYTRQESSSVKTEVAENIFKSILYNIDICLNNQADYEKALHLLAHEPIRNLFSQGNMLVVEEVKLTKLLLQDLILDKLPISHQLYNETINKEMGTFLRNYHAKFDAHNTPALIPYPLLFTPVHHRGILFLKKYIQRLALENQWCSHFTISDIRRLLENYGQKYKTNSRELYVNIFELVFKNALLLVIAGNTPGSLLFPQRECEHLQSQLAQRTDTEIDGLLGQAFSHLTAQFNVTDKRMIAYAKMYIHQLSPQLIAAIRSATLSQWLIVEAEPKNNTAALLYTPGKKLTDEKFQEVIEQVQACENGKEKAAIIQQKIRNIEDLMDLLSAYCIFGEEFTELFSSISKFELALLCTALLDNGPISENILSVDYLHNTENEICWQENLLQYLHCLDKNAYAEILDLAKHFQTSPLS